MSDITLNSLDAKLDAVKEIAEDTRQEIRRLNGAVQSNKLEIVALKAVAVTKDICSKTRGEKRGAFTKYIVAVGTGVTLFFLFELVPRVFGE
jgi:hypothetical protein